jgi:hypothetical protein
MLTRTEANGFLNEDDDFIPLTRTEANGFLNEQDEEPPLLRRTITTGWYEMCVKNGCGDAYIAELEARFNKIPGFDRTKWLFPYTDEERDRVMNKL